MGRQCAKCQAGAPGTGRRSWCGCQVTKTGKRKAKTSGFRTECCSARYVHYFATCGKDTIGVSSRALEDRLLFREEGPYGVAMIGGRPEPSLSGGLGGKRVRERPRGGIDEQSLGLRV